MPMVVAILLIISMIVILPTTNVAATTVILSKDGSAPYRNLTAGEVITLSVVDNSLNASEEYTVKVWNGSAWIALEDEDADMYGDVSIDFHVPGWDDLGMCPTTNKGDAGLSNGQWNISLFDEAGTQIGGNHTITIGNLYDVRYKYAGEFLDYIIYNTTYAPFYIYVYNWTSSGWEVEDDETFNITLYDPNGNYIDDQSGVTTGYWDYDFMRADNNYGNGHGNLETYYWVNVSIWGNPTLYANDTLPVKLNMTANVPSNVEWGDLIEFGGYIYDGQGNGVPNYMVRLYSPVNGGYYCVYETDTYSSGRYSVSVQTGSLEDQHASAGTWYIGTYNSTDALPRINETDILNIPGFIAYASFEVGTKDEAKVSIVSPDEIVSGFNQTINVSVYNASWMDNDEYKNMWIHVTGLEAWNQTQGIAYEDDDIVPVAMGCTYSTDKYAYYVFNYHFNETGTGTILVSWPGNLTSYANNDSFYSNTYNNTDLLANITGSTTFSVVSPGDMTVIVNDMIDEVSVTNVSGHSCCKQNYSRTITIQVFGKTQSDRMNASIKITGCGLDIEIDEEDAVADGYWVSQGVYQVPISPKTAGVITITCTNKTQNKSVSKDYTISGLSGTVTTSVGDDKEISVTTTETITVTVTNGQYADVWLCLFNHDWTYDTCLNDTTGDNTAGNGLNGVFEFIPDVDYLDHIGYIVVAANAGDFWMYDIIEVVPIHDLVVELIDPSNESLQTLTCGMEHDWEFQVKDANGDIVDDVDSVTGELIDEDGDTLQTVNLEKSGNSWVLDGWVPHFGCYFRVTARNNTNLAEHDGNATFDCGLAQITYSPAGATAGIGQENLTVEITAIDANGNPLPEGTKLYINVQNVNNTQQIDTTCTLDEDGHGEFDITKVGDNKTKVNVTLQGAYNAAYKGNLTEGYFMIDFPDFIVDPDTIYIGQANMVTITAKDYNGQPIEGINLTFVSSVPGILAAQPDPVQTDANGQVVMSLQPLASGTLNVTIARNVHYESGQLNWTNAVVTDTIVTVTSLKTLKISVSKSPIYEDETLTVTVTSGGSPVSGAAVEFAETTVQTDANGQATFTVPDPGVESAIYTITAEKTGYVSAEKSITIIKVYEITIIGPSKLPAAGETFTITILAKGSPLAGATITFDGTTYTSDGEGKVTLTAPDVTKDTEYTITASFENYKDGTLTVTIKAGGVPGFELITLIVAIGVAFILLRRRR